MSVAVYIDNVYGRCLPGVVYVTNWIREDDSLFDLNSFKLRPRPQLIANEVKIRKWEGLAQLIAIKIRKWEVSRSW